MEIKKVKCADIIINLDYLLSYPLQPHLFSGFEAMFPGFPGMVLNEKGELVAGLDFYLYKLIEYNKGVDAGDRDFGEILPGQVQGLATAAGDLEIRVLQSHLSVKEALFLNYNLKERWTGLNLYEKLIFIKKIEPHARRQELYQKTALDINMKPQLMDNLDTLLQPQFKEHLVSGALTLKTALGLCSFAGPDRPVLLELLGKIPFTSSQQLKLIETAEELIFREKRGLQAIFNELALEDLLEAERPQGEIMERLRAYRFPLHTQREKEFRQYLATLHLPAHIKVSHAPFFEKKGLEIKVSLQDPGDFPGTIAALGGKNRPLPPELTGGPGLAGQGNGSQGEDPNHKQTAKKGKK